MRLFSRSLWPERIRYPYLRLVLALISTPSIVASILTGLAYLAAQTTEPTDALAMLITMRSRSARSGTTGSSGQGFSAVPVLPGKDRMAPW